ncbi:MAG: peptide deformylase [Candidatus Solibacter usitatus]|nr:peptide deformylase [Candidatus Solibacter usitatus]
MSLKIVKYGDPVLERKCAPVEDFGSAELKQFVDDMFETMYAAKGIGLAAPQVSVSKRLTVIDCSAGEDETQRLVLINPELIQKEGSQTGEEGCLSIPGFREDVTRAMTAVVRARDVEGKVVEVSAEGLLSRAMQHEMDHLDGILFLSHLSPLKRDLIRRKIRKMVKAGEW